MQDSRFTEKIQATKPTIKMWGKIESFIGSHSTLEWTCRDIYTDARIYNLYNSFRSLYKDEYIALVKRTAKIIKS